MAEKRRTEGRHQPLAELAARQYGVVAARQLRALGYSADAVSTAARSGRLHRVYHGVYAVGHDRLEWRGRCMAAVLSSPRSVASHVTAGHLWGLLRFESRSMHLTSSTRRRPRPGLYVHFAVLADVDRGERLRIPVTSVPRTLVDLAATLAPAQLSRVVERAEELRLFDLAAVDELLARVTHHRGVAPLRDALCAYKEDPSLTRSELERRFRALVLAAGLSPPSMNSNVAGLEVDAYWESQRLAVELDTFATHGSRAAFERDRARDQRLRLNGVDVIRITAPQLEREPDRVAETIAVLLRRARSGVR